MVPSSISNLKRQLLFLLFLFFLARRVFLTEIELNTLDERFIKILAWQRIQQLFEPKALPVQSDAKISTVPPITQRSWHAEGTILKSEVFSRLQCSHSNTLNVLFHITSIIKMDFTQRSQF